MSDILSTIMSVSAASNAAEAAHESAAARAASEERLEGSTHNPFVTLKSVGFESVAAQGGGFLSLFFGIGSKKKLGSGAHTYSLKCTDIGYMRGATDDFGNPYTIVYLEERCNLRQDNDIFELYVPGTLEETQKYINFSLKGEK
jgi:hypothetical protein